MNKRGQTNSAYNTAIILLIIALVILLVVIVYFTFLLTDSGKTTSPKSTSKISSSKTCTTTIIPYKEREIYFEKIPIYSQRYSFFPHNQEIVDRYYDCFHGYCKPKPIIAYREVPRVMIVTKYKQVTECN